MMHVLEGEALGQDAATVEAAFKRHEAISTDVKARVSVQSFKKAFQWGTLIEKKVFKKSEWK